MKSICVKSLKDDSVVKRIDVTGKGKSYIEKVEDGLYQRIDLDNYYLVVEETP